MLFDFQAVFAKMEYKMIKKRMRQGKVAGAKKGMWTNGSPPYPYIYNRVTKQVEVDTEKLKIYRAMLEKYLLGMSTQEISVWLNKRAVAPPYTGKRNKYGWSHVTVHRILISEIHLGYVIYGKSHKHHGTAQLIDKEAWIKVKGEHEPVKTQEEHDQIMARIAQNTIIPRKCRVGTLPLSGLLYCSKCGRRMQFKRRNLVTVEMVQKRINEFKALWSNAIDSSEQNRAFRLLIDWIVHDREDNGLKLEVLYK